MNKYILLFIISFLIINTKTKGQSITLEYSTFGTIIIDEKINGSAFVLTKPNLVVTCAHVLVPDKTYFYRPLNGVGSYQLKPIFIDIERDLALLESSENITTKPLHPIPEFNVKPGQHLFYMGYNASKSTKVNTFIQVDNAVVSSIGLTKIGNSLVDFIEFHGVGVPGYSGGPVFNDDGNVVGLMREAWQKRGVYGGDVFLINRAFSIVPIIEKIPIDK